MLIVAKQAPRLDGLHRVKVLRSLLGIAEGAGMPSVVGRALRNALEHHATAHSVVQRSCPLLRLQYGSDSMRRELAAAQEQRLHW